MDALEKLNAIEEKLRKASDRIKSGKRTNRNTKISTAEAMNAIKSLMASEGLSHETKSALKNMSKQLGERAEKERIAAMSANSKPIELGARGKAAVEAKQQMRDQIAEHVSQQPPKQIKELGNAAEYEASQQPAARPKTSGQMTGPVRARMATGEGIAVPDREFGANLDFQRQLKEKEEKLKTAKGPEAVIRVPKRYHEDDQVNTMMELKNHVDPQHHAEIDSDINKRLSEIGKKGA